MTKSKCPRCEGKTLTYYHWLLNILYASVCRLYWDSESNYWFHNRKFVAKGYLDLILRFQRTTHIAIIKIKVMNIQITWNLSSGDCMSNLLFCIYFNAIFKDHVKMSHELRNCDSSSTIIIYYTHLDQFVELGRPGRSFGVCTSVRILIHLIFPFNI